MSGFSLNLSSTLARNSGEATCNGPLFLTAPRKFNSLANIDAQAPHSDKCASIAARSSPCNSSSRYKVKRPRTSSHLGKSVFIRVIRGSNRPDSRLCRTARKQLPKFPARTSESRHYSARRTVQHRRDLLISKSFDIAQHDDFAISVRQTPNRLSHFFPFQVSQVEDVRILLSSVHGSFVLVEIDEMRSAVLVTHLIQPGVSHDGEQPTLQIAIVGSIGGARCSHISFLYEVFCVARIARQSNGIAVERIDVLQCCLTE